jgi:methenyltetrahydromethanopterin cyclohydrolase
MWLSKILKLIFQHVKKPTILYKEVGVLSEFQFNTSINDRSAEIIEKKVIPNADKLNIEIHRLNNGATVLDMGINAKGGWLAGKYFTEIGLGGLGELSFTKMKIGRYFMPALKISVDLPTIAEMSSHVAFWRVPWQGKNVNISGPIRSIKRPDIFSQAVSYQDKWAKKIVAEIQTTEMPDEAFTSHLAEQAGYSPKDLYVIVAKTGTLVGAIQVGARNVEQTLPTLFDHGLKMDWIVQANGITPMVSVVDDELIAYGRVNDSLIYGQESNVYVNCEDEDIISILDRIPFYKNKDVFGIPFQDLFARSDNDWTKVSRDWDAPCKVNLFNIKTGHSFSTGRLSHEVLEKSFLG